MFIRDWPRDEVREALDVLDAADVLVTEDDGTVRYRLDGADEIVEGFNRVKCHLISVSGDVQVATE